MTFQYGIARNIQTKMNWGEDSKTVHKEIPGYIATTVDYVKGKDSYEFHVWIDGREYGLEQIYRLDWEFAANVLHEVELKEVYRLFAGQVASDLAGETADV